VPLEILHRAAPCRNVPVTFTLDLMPSYSWRCLACGGPNAAGVDACATCACPAAATVAQIQAARRKDGHIADGLTSEALLSIPRGVGWTLLALGGFGLTWSDIGWLWVASAGLMGLGAFILIRWHEV
jgi:hypothetical protein